MEGTTIIEARAETDSTETYDEVDSARLCRQNPVKKRPPRTALRARDQNDFYRMDHPRRGDCLIFSYSIFKKKSMNRRCSNGDAARCEETFKRLGFRVQIHDNLKKRELKKVLEKASEADHSDCDALVVVFMSHGMSDSGGRERLCTSDSSVPTSALWEPFLDCTTLRGKPKLFFIQACRGDNIDTGVGLKVSTDGRRKHQPAVPTQPDVLVMWGSYGGLFSFRTTRQGINGSVFLHFLTQTLVADTENGSPTPLMDLLLKVSRQVAINFESEAPGKLDYNKQMPQLSSTLLKNIVFMSPSKRGDSYGPQHE